MLLGRFEHTIDERGRLTLPSKYCSRLAAGVAVARGFDGCLCIYPVREWEQLMERVEQLPLVQAKVRDFVRFYFHEASETVPDKEGRVLVPAHLRKYANLKADVTITGSRDHLKVWNPEALEKRNVILQEDTEGVAEKLSELGVL